MKKNMLKWLVILVVMISAVWIFLDIVSVKETKSFSSRDGDIFNSSAADKLFSFFTIFSNQGSKKEVFYEKIDQCKNSNHESAENVGGVENNAFADK